MVEPCCKSHYDHCIILELECGILPEANSKALSGTDCPTKLGVPSGNPGPHSRQEVIKELDREAKVALEEVGVQPKLHHQPVILPMLLPGSVDGMHPKLMRSPPWHQQQHRNSNSSPSQIHGAI